MNVSDLIKHLLKFPQDLPVLVREDEFIEWGLSRNRVKLFKDGEVSYLAIDLMIQKEYL
jgi:hypothetical protein